MSRVTRTVVYLGVCVALVTLGVAVIGGQQPPTSGPFAVEQASTGRQIYEASCASCHRPDLGGGAEAPALTGVNFMNTWGMRPTRELTEYIRVAMPPGAAPMPAQQALALTAFILQTNGARAGAIPLASGEATSIAAAVRGQTPAGATAPVPAPAAAVPVAGATPLTPGRGLTVPGDIQNYVPVTDAMLRNPPAGDWLMIRRNYQAWSHSPLTDITPANVGRLRMVWQWAMNEGGASEPTPIVHNGIIYLYNTGNLVQALEGLYRQLALGTQRRP